MASRHCQQLATTAQMTQGTLNSLVRLTAVFYVVSECYLATGWVNEARINMSEVSQIQWEGDPQDLSCAGQCGQTGTSCSCHTTCVVYRNCCEDFESACQNQVNVHEAFEQFSEKFLFSEITCIEPGFFVVSSCPQERVRTGSTDYDVFGRTPTAGPELEDLTYDLDGISTRLHVKSLVKLLMNVPYSDPLTGIAYLNKEVFDCHNNGSREHGIPWRIKLVYKVDNRAENFYELSELVISQFTRYVPPESIQHMTYVCELESINFCPDPVDSFSPIDLHLYDLCFSHHFSFVSNNRSVFKNKYCAMCNAGLNLTLSPTRPTVTHDKDWIFYGFGTISSDNMLRLELRSSFYGNDNLAWRQSSCNISQILNKTSVMSKDIPCGNFTCDKNSFSRGDLCMKSARLVIGITDAGSPFSPNDLDRVTAAWNCFLKDVFRLDVESSVSSEIISDHPFHKQIYTSTHHIYATGRRMLSLESSHQLNKVMAFAKAMEIFRAITEKFNCIDLSRDIESTLISIKLEKLSQITAPDMISSESIMCFQLYPEDFLKNTSYSFFSWLPTMASNLSCFDESMFVRDWSTVLGSLDIRCQAYVHAYGYDSSLYPHVSMWLLVFSIFVGCSRWSII